MQNGRFKVKRTNFDDATDTELEASKSGERLLVRTSEIVDVKEGNEFYKRVKRA